MKNVRLKKMSLLNFKGIRQFAVEFGDENKIYGRNATGKSTLMDAFLWLCFRKDAQGRMDYEIKTLDEKNEPYHRLEHEVAGVFEVNGEEVELRRVYREKWVKKRGNPKEDFTGHEVEHFWNGVPLSETEYKSKIAELFDENVFRLVTNTSYFNSLEWKKRREILTKIAGELSDDEVLEKIATINNKSEIMQLTAALNQRKTLDQFSAEIAAKKKKIKDELLLLPARIEEAQRNLPDLTELPRVESEIAGAKHDLQLIENQLTDIAEAAKADQERKVALLKKQSEIGNKMRSLLESKKSKFSEKVNELLTRAKEKEYQIASKKDNIRIISRSIEGSYLQLEDFKKQKAKYLESWREINAKELKFNEGDFACPTCKRGYEVHDIEAKKEELTKNFNEDKSKKLAANIENGKRIAGYIKDTETDISSKEAEIQKTKNELSELETTLEAIKTEYNRVSASSAEMLKRFEDTDAEYLALNTEYNSLQENIEYEAKPEWPEQLKIRKSELQSSIDALYKSIPSRETHERMTLRIAELQKQEEAQNQELANLEQLDLVIAKFTKMKMDEVERRVNEKFKFVKFKMFEKQINEGIKPTCQTLVDGVPYPAANTASQVQAGLDIINTLSNHYGITGPIWIDNRESVTDLPETNCQLISLIVSPKDKTLRVETTEALETVA